MENWLVVGSGGREYVIAETLAKNKQRHVFVAPGNPKMADLPRVEPISIDELAFSTLADFANSHQVTCTVVGPEQPLSKGIVDYFEARQLPIFGPNQVAAQLESSKTFAKQMMAVSGVPTAQYQEFDNQTAALQYVSQQALPLVIKADGLASGKGVIIADTKNAAEQAVAQLMAGPQSKLLIEDYLVGEEFSLFALVDGTRFITMPVAQDHKRLEDGDLGPNTGGMGAYSPVPHITEALKQEAVQEVVMPILKTMVDQKTPFRGFLYAGLIKTTSGIKVIEFNVRMGDPETQVVLPQLQSDLGELILQLKRGQQPVAKWQTDQYYLGTVVASRDYPRQAVNGRPLPNIQATDVQVSFAGVVEENGQVVSHGGRVLMVTATAATIRAAQQRVNQVLDDSVDQTAYTFRHDIGFHALTPSPN
ncbi:purD protein [Secundilactobacillus odoratitofui DSM 19909 = JCM 15043]|uniref:Phosphoribosylamine--glycine ligase n=1 Tax=Secundilactobacillus odoratitofui DSM 19909 = JCM 15043 TaxID=1423776 RepID=A0A0R1LPI9_9LACO|nr:phosphoribosylamine--glycine ligase [Secundilactobacillus odoratitofui]KRK97725.1 purD protein [Secundilactobacillus odoratitofui DSM 19909 = JCM 15043]